MSQENNFIPSQDGYKPLTPFRLFVKSNFPFIENTYEALDNYGLYSKVVEYLNTVIENENTVESNVSALYNAFVSLNNYISDYFDNLDVQEEINNKLDEMVTTGELQSIFSNIYNDLQNQIDVLSSGSPAGVYATYNDLVNANPDHSKIYIVTSDGKWYYFNTSNNTWTAGGQYQSTGLILDNTLTSGTNPSQGLEVGDRIKLIESIENYSFDSSLFENGGLNDNGAVTGGHLYRFRSKSILYSTQDLYFILPFGYRIGLHTYNNDGSHIAWSGWNLNQNVNEMKIPKNTYFKILGARITEDTTEVIDYTSIINNSLLFTDKTLIETTINDLINNKLNVEKFINSDMSTGVYVPSRTYRIASRFKLILPFDLYINIPEGFECGYNSYNKSNLLFIAWSGWKIGQLNQINGRNILIIPANTMFVLQIRRITENTDETLPINEIIPLFQFYQPSIYNQLAYNSISKETKTFEITCRQGEVDNYPENTLQAFKRAKDFGYNHIRVSFGWTSDNIAICSHFDQVSLSTLRNNDGSAITDTSILLSNLTYDYIIENFDAGIYKGANFAGIRVPTLEAVLKQAKRLNQKIDIEYKFGYTQQNLENLLSLIYTLGLQDVCIYSCEVSSQINIVKNSTNKIKTALIEHLTSYGVNRAITHGVDRLDTFNRDTYDANLVLLAHQNNIKVKVGSSYRYNTAVDFIDKYDVIECAEQINPVLIINN